MLISGQHDVPLNMLTPPLSSRKREALSCRVGQSVQGPQTSNLALQAFVRSRDAYWVLFAYFEIRIVALSEPVRRQGSDTTGNNISG